MEKRKESKKLQKERDRGREVENVRWRERKRER
jgi:hypothetical protein